MKVGTILIAINKCEMDIRDNINALILDKEYKVYDIVIDEIVIKSEIDKRHLFSLDENSTYYWGLFFKLRS